MSPLLQLALDHHLYLWAAAGGVIWYMNWRHARQNRPGRAHRAGPPRAAKDRLAPGVAGHAAGAGPNDLRARLAELQAQREAVARRISALVGRPAAGEPVRPPRSTGKTGRGKAGGRRGR